MNETQNIELLKVLQSKSEKSPYFLKGDSEDIEYLGVTSLYPTLFFFDEANNAIFSFQFLKNFWFNEIETFFFFSKKEECEISDIILSGLGAFHKTFKKSHPEIPSIFANVSHAEIEDYEDNFGFFLNPNENYSVNTALIISFIERRVLDQTKNFKITFGKHYDDSGRGITISRVTKKNHGNIIYEISKIMRSIPDREIPLTLLCHRLNSLDKEFDIEKPIDDFTLQRILLSVNDKRFKIDYPDKLILNDENEYLPKYFIEERELLKNFNFNKPTSGILSFSYLGNKFPLIEAEEYVKVRPIINLTLVKNLEDDFPKIIADLQDEESFSPEREFVFLLKTVLPPSTSLEEWLNENVAVSFYEEDYQDLKLVRAKIITHLSPVFNLAQNPGHLFQFTLKKKLEEYTSLPSREPKNGI